MFYSESLPSYSVLLHDSARTFLNLQLADLYKEFYVEKEKYRKLVPSTEIPTTQSTYSDGTIRRRTRSSTGGVVLYDVYSQNSSRETSKRKAVSGNNSSSSAIEQLDDDSGDDGAKHKKKKNSLDNGVGKISSNEPISLDDSDSDSDSGSVKHSVTHTSSNRTAVSVSSTAQSASGIAARNRALL